MPQNWIKKAIKAKPLQAARQIQHPEVGKKEIDLQKEEPDAYTQVACVSLT